MVIEPPRALLVKKGLDAAPVDLVVLGHKLIGEVGVKPFGVAIGSIVQKRANAGVLEERDVEQDILDKRDGFKRNA